MSYIFKHYVKGNTQGSGSYVFRKYSESVEPQVEAFITFSSPSSFTLATNNSTKNWDGTIEYSTNKTNWTEWSGTSAISSGVSGSSNVLYLRGIGNTQLCKETSSSPFDRYSWKLNGDNISCKGNIETLLDYQTVLQGNHPPMATYCYNALFRGNTSLIDAPMLCATTLVIWCYSALFWGCTNLKSLPSLSVLDYPDRCCQSMFQNCSNIKMSETQTAEYQNEYRVPISGNGTIGSFTLYNMFRSTGGTFTGTPTINTTYYTSNAIVNADGTITPAIS